MEISHLSHEHPLTLCVMADTGEPCNGCSRPIFDRGYVCLDCGFLLHKKCAKLPWKVHHHLHPKHPLALLFDSSETSKCSVCNKTGSGLAFKCQDCPYYMDVTCFFRNQPYLDLPPLEGKTRKLPHFSHNHTLTLCYLTQHSKRKCQGCDQQILGPAYCCKECNLFTLHKSCAQLPWKREHPFHPSHSLLLTESPYPGSRAACNACGKIIQGFVYHCDKCSFDLHLLCACLTPSLKHEKHDHLLAFFDEINYQVLCDSCGKSCRNNLYRCVSCNFNVHSTCLPSVKHKHHPHPLTLKDSTPKDDSSTIHFFHDQDQLDIGKLLEDMARVQEELDAIASQLKRDRGSVSTMIQHKQQQHYSVPYGGGLLRSQTLQKVRIYNRIIAIPILPLNRSSSRDSAENNQQLQGKKKKT